MTRRPSPARRATLAVSALLVAAPVLSSCGFNYATNRVNTISMGVDDRAGQVDVLGTVIVSGQAGSGTFVSTLVNNDPTEPASFTELTGTDTTTGTVVAAESLEPIEIPPRGRVTLGNAAAPALTEGDPSLVSDPQDVVVTGDFVPGDFVTVDLVFASGESTSLEIPVVPSCRQWEGLDNSAEALAAEGDGSSGGAGGASTPESEESAEAAESEESADRGVGGVRVRGHHGGRGPLRVRAAGARRRVTRAGRRTDPEGGPA